MSSGDSGRRSLTELRLHPHPTVCLPVDLMFWFHRRRELKSHHLSSLTENQTHTFPQLPPRNSNLSNTLLLFCFLSVIRFCYFLSWATSPPSGKNRKYNQVKHHIQMSLFLSFPFYNLLWPNLYQIMGCSWPLGHSLDIPANACQLRINPDTELMYFRN